MEQGNIQLKGSFSHLKLFLFEVFTTAFLVMAINFSLYNKVIVCGAVWVCCMVTNTLTGTHMNLAFSLAVYFFEGKYRRNFKPLINYVIAGLVGAALGTAITHWMLGRNYVVIFKPAVYQWNVFYVAFVEFFFTLIFLLVVMHNKTVGVTLISDLVIGVMGSMIALYFSICCSALYTGACLSPTVALINHIYVHIAWDDPSLYIFTPSYIIGPALAGILAAVFAKNLSARFAPLPELYLSPLLAASQYPLYGYLAPKSETAMSDT